MTLEEAIEHANAVADSYEDTDPDCQCARDHRRLARWLTELKLARESVFAQIPQMARTIHENHRLKAENASLRERDAKLGEFASCLVSHIDPALLQCSCNVECPAHRDCAGKAECKFSDWALEMAETLGLEVGH